ncbi:MAG: rluD [Cyanobacteria bacterium RYN_339]|nr:rluD [Cyanobacteria bacterium RYN_339]
MSEEETYIVTPEEAGQRLDQFCQAQLEGISRARVQAWIDEGQVSLNDKPTKASQRLKANDRVGITEPPIEPTAILPEAIPLTIVYEDADLLVIDKPQGMVVHPAPGNAGGTLVNALLHHCKDLSGVGGVARPGIVHRLDKDTSGLLVVAKHDRAHAGLAAQIQAKDALRQYWAVVRGHMESPDGRIDAPIARHPTQRQKMAVVQGGRQAATRWQVLETFRGYDLVELTLETGRTHQIRVHLAHLGHPVVGDAAYGGEVKVPVKLAGQALHARRLAFVHPVSGEAMQFEAEPPENFRKLLAYLR